MLTRSFQFAWKAPIFLLLLTLSLPGQASEFSAKPDCAPQFRLQAKTKNFDPKQSNLWKYTFRRELTDNISRFREDPEETVFMSMVKVDSSEVDVIPLGEVNPQLLKKFSGDDAVYWPLHPLNTDFRVPYQNKVGSRKMEVKPTASRSLLSFEEDSPAFSIKAGTDHPHKEVVELEKISTKDDVRGALLRQPYLTSLEKILPPDDSIVFLPEALILRHRATGEGVLIRDLSRIDNENIYLTGLNIPFLGREIAQQNNSDFIEFWTKHYSERLGRAKARMLLHYGMEMETPNSQNILIEFDKDMRPTGKLVIRDTVDSSLYKAWLHALGLKNIDRENARLGYYPIRFLEPHGKISHFRFDEAGDFRITEEQIRKMVQAHDNAWLQEVKFLLGIKNDALTSTGRMDQYLSSRAGRAAMRAYHEKLGSLEKIQSIDRAIGESPSQVDGGEESQWLKSFQFWK